VECRGDCAFPLENERDAFVTRAYEELLSAEEEVQELDHFAMSQSGRLQSLSDMSILMGY